MQLIPTPYQIRGAALVGFYKLAVLLLNIVLILINCLFSFGGKLIFFLVLAGLADRYVQYLIEETGAEPKDPLDLTWTDCVHAIGIPIWLALSELFAYLKRSQIFPWHKKHAGVVEVIQKPMTEPPVTYPIPDNVQRILNAMYGEDSLEIEFDEFEEIVRSMPKIRIREPFPFNPEYITYREHIWPDGVNPSMEDFHKYPEMIRVWKELAGDQYDEIVAKMLIIWAQDPLPLVNLNQVCWFLEHRFLRGGMMLFTFISPAIMIIWFAWFVFVIRNPAADIKRNIYVVPIEEGEGFKYLIRYNWCMSMCMHQFIMAFDWFYTKIIKQLVGFSASPYYWVYYGEIYKSFTYMILWMCLWIVLCTLFRKTARIPFFHRTCLFHCGIHRDSDEKPVWGVPQDF